MDLEITLANECIDPDKGYSGCDIIVKDRDSGCDLPWLQGLSFEINIDDVVMTAQMTILLQGVHFIVPDFNNSGNNGVPTTVRFEGDPDRVEEMFIRVQCPNPSIEIHTPNPDNDSSKYSRLDKTYSIPCAVDIMLFDAKTGDRLLNVKKFKFGASINDTVIKAEAIVSGKKLIRWVYGIGSADPIRVET